MPIRPNLLLTFVVFTVLLICFLVIGISYCFWDELTENEAISSVIRNLCVAAGVPIAIVVALWRSIIANWQVSAAYKQVETALEQTEIAQENLLRGRFQSAAEMLGHDSVAVRIGGVQSLAELAAQNMDRYYVSVGNLLEAFSICATQVGDATLEGATELGDDIQVARDAVKMLERLRTKGVKRIEMDEMQDLLPIRPQTSD